MMGRRADIDLTGQSFYELYVKGPSNIRVRNRPTWDCVCTCGKECNYTTYELKSGKRKSCGHLMGKSKALDLTGQTFNDLTVLYRVSNKGNSKAPNGNVVGRTYWRCICVCGKECDVQTSDLTSNKRKDCGHSHDAYMHEIRTQDVSGKTFGCLKVLEMLPSMKVGKKWRAMCRAQCVLCGNIIDVQRDYLISGDTQSDGCLKSKGELEITNYLNEHNICFKKQYSFNDLLTPKGWRCYFDFAILKDNSLKCLIEFQGEQHFIEKPGPWEFGKYEREITDPLKRKYCQDHNIKLYEICFNQNIKEELDKIFAC